MAGKHHKESRTAALLSQELTTQAWRLSLVLWSLVTYRSVELCDSQWHKGGEGWDQCRRGGGQMVKVASGEEEHKSWASSVIRDEAGPKRVLTGRMTLENKWRGKEGYWLNQNTPGVKRWLKKEYRCHLDEVASTHVWAPPSFAKYAAILRANTKQAVSRSLRGHMCTLPGAWQIPALIHYQS